jgi:hypothetical protein
MSSRSIAGRPLDLQLIPRAAVREIRRELPGAVVIDTDGPVSRSRLPDWIVAATADLVQPDQRLRSFLSQFGSLLDGRAGYEPLMQLRVCLAEATTRGGALEDLVDVIAERFPTNSDARRLKAAVLGPQRLITRSLYPDRQDSDLLMLLATTEHEQAFDVSDLKIDERVRNLWIEDRALAGSFVDRLLSGNHNQIGERALTVVLTAMPIEQIPEAFADKPAILVSAVRRDPNLATLASLWSGSADRQRELFDAATAGRQVDDSLGEHIVVAMLNAGSDSVAGHVLRRFGDVVVCVVLDWFNNSTAGGAASLPAGWRRCLAQYSPNVLEWLRTSRDNKPHSAALAAEILDPHARNVHAAGLDLWIETITKSSSLPEDARIRLHAFGLALAFDIASPKASSLAVLTFDTVHNAAARSRLDYDAWSLFENHVPFLSWWRNWDKCERLRRGLIERFERNRWAVDQFIRCTKSVDTFVELLKTSRTFPEGKSLLRRLQNEEFQLVKELPPDWRAAFSYYV